MEELVYGCSSFYWNQQFLVTFEALGCISSHSVETSNHKRQLLTFYPSFPLLTSEDPDMLIFNFVLVLLIFGLFLLFLIL